MEVNWRALFDAINVPWVDRGSNVSRGNINIKCPWCFDDPSHHLGVSLAKEAFYCYREPDRHSGRSFVGLLIKLHQTHAEATRLLNEFSFDVTHIPRERPVNLTKALSNWERFQPAHKSPAMIRYLEGRGFPSAHLLCELYDLRYAPSGKWANRLLIPLHHKGQVVTWTGRDITGRSELRYKLNPIAGISPCFVADRKKPHPRTLVIVEGALGAIRISMMLRRDPVVCIALTGKALGDIKMLDIALAGKGCENILVALDPDVRLSSCFHVIHELASLIPARYIGRAPLPEGCTGPDEMEPEGVAEWLKNSLSRLRCAPNSKSARERELSSGRVGLIRPGRLGS